MPSLPIVGSKEKLTYKEALQLVKEKKQDGFKAFYERYNSSRNGYQVIWY